MTTLNLLTLPIAFTMALMLNAPALRAEPASRDNAPTTAESRFSDLHERFEASKAAMLARHMNATSEERASLPDINIEPYRELLPRFSEAAQQFAESKEGFPFLLWLVNAGKRLEQGKPIDPNDPLLNQQRWALDALLKHHPHDERMSDVIKAVIYSYHLSPAYYQHVVRSIQQSTPFRRIKAECQYAIALKAPDAVARESLFEIVLEIDPEGWAADNARASLFELRHLSVGSTPPEFSGISPEGKVINLSDYRGSVLVLYFTSINCYPCREELPSTKTMLAKHADGPLTQLSVFTGPESRDDVQAYVDQFGVTWPVILDRLEPGNQGWYGPIGSLWNIDGLPTVYVLDQNGVVRYKYVRGNDLDRAVEALLTAMD